MATKGGAAAVATAVSTTLYPLKGVGLVDIGINLTDDMYKGMYNHNSTPAHANDLDAVVKRAADMGVTGLIITGGNIQGSTEAVNLAIAYNKKLMSSGTPLKCFATVGCHPTRSNEMKKMGVDKYLDALRALLKAHTVKGRDKADPEGVVVAIGEFGLDYDRLHFSSKADQLVGFKAQFELVREFELPLFLHSRAAAEDFSEICKAEAETIKKVGGVVHSFTGSLEELDTYLALGFHIGVNGCSLKTDENLQNVKRIPLDRVHLETDAPWCEIKNSHASSPLVKGGPAQAALASRYKENKKEKFAMGHMVKSRNEPCKMVEVLEAVYQLRKEEVKDREELAAIVLKNTQDVFPIA